MSEARRLRGETVPVSSLTPAMRDSLWELFVSYYDEVTRARFEADLDGKELIVLTRDQQDGSIRGFCTLRYWEGRVEGRPYRAVFTGDTIIDRAYHGQTALHRQVFLQFVSAKLRNPLTPVFWFLISKGYKTYLMLTRNFPEHWPRHERSTPPWERAVIEDLARRIDRDAWQPDRGVLRFVVPHGRLREGVAPVGARELGHPDVRFFVEQNPGHLRGDELCCIGRIDLQFASYFTTRVLRKVMSSSASGSLSSNETSTRQ